MNVLTSLLPGTSSPSLGLTLSVTFFSPSVCGRELQAADLDDLGPLGHAHLLGGDGRGEPLDEQLHLDILIGIAADADGPGDLDLVLDERGRGRDDLARGQVSRRGARPGGAESDGVDRDLQALVVRERPPAGEGPALFAPSARSTAEAIRTPFCRLSDLLERRADGRLLPLRRRPILLRRLQVDQARVEPIDLHVERGRRSSSAKRAPRRAPPRPRPSGCDRRPRRGCSCSPRRRSGRRPTPPASPS